MIVFQRVRVSDRFVEELGDLLWSGRSVILLGPRNVGKRYVTRRLDERLRVLGRGRVETVAFLAGSGASATSLDFDEVIRRLDERLDEGPGTVTLIASNVDAKPHAEIRAFLYQLRARIDANVPGRGTLVFALTGERDLSRFTSPGPLSDLPCERQFIIQGFAEKEFKECALRYLETLRPSAREGLGAADLDHLYRKTGGNTYFFRLLLWSAADRVAFGTGDPPDVPESVNLAAADHSLSEYYFRYISELIDADPGCWPDLERLIAEGHVDYLPTYPHALELAGVAARASGPSGGRGTASEGGRLAMPETLIRDYIVQHYTPRRFADLYASENRWPEAFERYGRVDAQDRRRPTDLDDLADAEDAVKNLRTSLYRVSTEQASTEADGLDAVLRLFCEGCRLVLGFGEVTRWRRIASWEPVCGVPFDDPGEGVDYLGVLGRITKRSRAGRLDSSEDGAASVTLRDEVVPIGVGTEHPHVAEVILVGRPGERSILSLARRRMIDRLADDFLVAHGHALRDRMLRQRRQFQDDFAAFASEIAGQLGRDISGIRGALEAAAKRLRRLAYSRVIFAVLDPARRRAIPVALEYDPSVYRDVPTKWLPMPLDGREPSAMRWVLRYRRALMIRDAATDRRVRNDVARKLKIKGAAVVPILDPGGTVVGIIQVERASGLMPTREEANDLLEFGKKLAVALGLSEQIAMLQESLGALRTPILLFGHDGRLRYASREAERYVGVKSQWYDAGAGPPYTEVAVRGLATEDLTKFTRAVACTLETGRPAYESHAILYYDRVFHFATRADPLWDWRLGLQQELSEVESLAGVLLHARNETDVVRTFQALEVLLGAAGRFDEVIEKTVEAIQVLGYRWARLYKVSEAEGGGQGRPQLVSSDGFGFPDDTLKLFRAGEFRIPASEGGADWEGWFCFEAGHPVVLHHDPTQPDRHEWETDKGVRTYNCRQPTCHSEFAKAPGELWVDFPLMAGSRRVGKLTLECNAKIPPEHLRLLDILCKLTSALLVGSLKSEGQLRDLARVLERTAERSVHDALHSINSYFGDLSPALSRLKIAADLLSGRRGRRSTQSEPDRRRFEEACQRVEVVYGQICAVVGDRLQRKLNERLKVVSTDLYWLIRELASIGFENAAVVPGPPEVPDRVLADVDAGWLLESLAELVHNAARFPREPGRVRVLVSAEVVAGPDGREWVQIAVRDNGKGIAPTRVASLFESREPSRRGNDGHTGSGLLDVKAMAEAHGGSVRHAPEADYGAVFLITLPRLRRDDAPAPNDDDGKGPVVP